MSRFFMVQCVYPIQ